MGGWFVSFVARTLSLALSVLLVAHLLRGIHVSNFSTAVGVALVYGVFNFIAYSIFGLLTLPFGILTLGLGFWVINTILLLLTSGMISGFHVDGFVWAMIGSAFIAVLNCIIHGILNVLLPS